MTIVPVVINSVSSDIDVLHNLARCPDEGDYDCGDRYKNLEVGDVDELETILNDLVELTGCTD